MRTPEDLTDAEINDLVENGRAPMSAEGKRLFELGSAMMRALNPELLFRAKPDIDLRRRQYDIQTDYSTAAPRHLAYSAIDLNTYDGAPDSSGISTCIGRGPTAQAARFDLLEQMAEYTSEDPFSEEAADARYEVIPGTLGLGSEPADYMPRHVPDPDEEHEA